MYKMIMHSKLLEIHAQRHEIPSKLFQTLVNWEVMGKARKTANLKLKIFITKWVSGETATGKVMVRRKQRLYSHCPMCKQAKEDTTHILQCSEKTICALKIKLLLELQAWLGTNDTQEELKLFISRGLLSWMNTTSISNPNPYETNTNIAFKYQNLLGWESLLHGFIAPKIIQLQQKHYTEHKSRKLGTKWGELLIIKLWQIIQQIWTHRNNMLHETEAINYVSGMEHLQEAIFLEHLQGLDNLPYVYASYFLISLPTLFKKKATHLKQWFLVIRSGRESCDPDSFSDIFATNTCLRKWVGLSIPD